MVRPRIHWLCHRQLRPYPLLGRREVLFLMESSSRRNTPRNQAGWNQHLRDWHSYWSAYRRCSSLGNGTRRTLSWRSTHIQERRLLLHDACRRRHRAWAPCQHLAKPLSVRSLWAESCQPHSHAFQHEDAEQQYSRARTCRPHTSTRLLMVDDLPGLSHKRLPPACDGARDDACTCTLGQEGMACGQWWRHFGHQYEMSDLTSSSNAPWPCSRRVQLRQARCSCRQLQQHRIALGMDEHRQSRLFALLTHWTKGLVASASHFYASRCSHVAHFRGKTSDWATFQRHRTHWRIPSGRRLSGRNHGLCSTPEPLWCDNRTKGRKAFG